MAAAVAEWLGVPEASPAWQTFCWREGREGCLLRPTTAGKVSGVPAVCRDPRGWIADPVLPLMAERVGTWWWGVALTGAADPPAVLTCDEGETWDTCGPTFSGYVYTVLFDAAFHDPQGLSREVWLEAGVWGDLRALRAEFRAEPTSREPPGRRPDLTERYSGDGQRVSLCHEIAPAGEPFRRVSLLRLWAANEERFRDLGDRIGRFVPALAGLTPDRDRPLSVPADRPAAGESDFYF